MEREILFRGKRADNGEWVYGLLSFIGTHNGEPAEKILTLDFDEEWIRPKTRGEYTGLTDRNGKKIFEGDIIKYKGELLEVRYSDKQARFLTVFLNGVYVPNPTITMAKGKIIGNIHDNPELMKGE